MSGICGICEPGRTWNSAGINAMLAALALPGETGLRTPDGVSVVLGVSQRWHFQQVAHIPGIRIAADAELLNRQELTKLLTGGDFDRASLTPAELLARLYRERGVSFVELLDGVFSFALSCKPPHAAFPGLEKSRGRPGRSAPGKLKIGGDLQGEPIFSLPGPAAALDPGPERPVAGCLKSGMEKGLAIRTERAMAGQAMLAVAGRQGGEAEQGEVQRGGA